MKNENNTSEKLEKYKSYFLKVHKKQLENEKDKNNLLKKLLVNTIKFLLFEIF